MTEETLTAEQLRSVIHYDPETGIFTRLARLAQRHQVGDRADTEITSKNMRGYRRVSLFSKRYLAHRLAWLYVYGMWPESLLDHRNGSKGDNRISNLREGSDRLNAENMHRPRLDNKSGYLGVHWHTQNCYWIARIQVRRKTIHLGCFDDPAIAHQSYLTAKRKYHEGCTI